MQNIPWFSKVISQDGGGPVRKPMTDMGGQYVIAPIPPAIAVGIWG